MQAIVSIQLLRAVAAIGVAAFHVQFDLQRYYGLGHLLPDLTVGAAGVDLFFVISGFIMAWTSGHLFGTRGAASGFLWRRVARIVPLYWAVTALYLGITLVLPGSGPSYSPVDVAASLLFIPALRPDGTIVQPIVGQGWSLNYEMFFYGLFAIALLFRRSLGLSLLCLMFTGLVAAHFTFDLGTILHFWTMPLILEFVFGLSIGIAARSGFVLPRYLAVALISAGLILLFAPWAPIPTESNRPFVWGIPAAMIVAGLVLGRLEPKRFRWSILTLGDASYALYLLHALCARAVLLVAAHLGLDLSSLAWPLLLVSVSLGVAISVVVHMLFERPVSNWLKLCWRPAQGMDVSSSSFDPSPTEKAGATLVTQAVSSNSASGA